jgi:hypothetical protein
MIEGGVGGSKTQTGIKFEKDTDLKLALLSKDGITMNGNKVFVSTPVTKL